MGLILASASPRRQELLRLITEDFTVFPAAVEESLPPALSVLDAAQYLARKKACAVAEQYPEHVVLGSDTTVVLGNGILGKPGTPERAAEMLRMLSGKTHQVVTGVALAKGTRVVSFQTETEVTFYPLNMDPKDVEKKITDKTKMIIPVHIGGYPVDMDPIMALAKQHDIVVLEDAAHAFGGEYKHRKLGTIGDFGSFSFHEVKNITSFGEGGILCSNVTEFLPEMRRARFLGTDFSKHIPNWLYDVTAIRGKNGPFVATNFSTTEIQGLGLQLQIARIDQIIEARRRASEYLTKRLSACDALIPQDLGNDEIKPTFHLYQLQIIPEKAGGDIQLFKKKMDAKGVTQIPHFGPLYKFEILREYGYDEKAIAESCPVCEEVFNHRFTHFPVYGLTPEQLDYMADAILESVDEMQRGV